ncbi:Acyl-CoA dehydrogenase domain protein [Desulfatibacillum aliphaticivorans]|uniref:Acyl-CoA dehydrogenase domain protein n=1 Tax=Desulfatibacillum aliphaticivorans TaxID=218208 RepID=B8FAM1_DESAL|nr:acyl-CoA dehydrogenase [Desulfatibacillum aliphaticivorans]ACL03317.1 Acyl-CoA dehydrogenase domain protein [Desulfatibacillum aliphaticivorans]
MPDPIQAIKEWCKSKLTQDVVNAMDQGVMSAVPLYKEFAQEGLMEFVKPTEGAAALPNLTAAVKILAAYSGDFGNIVTLNCLGAMLLGLFGDEAQKKISEEMLRGEKLFCFSLTEPEAGSDIQNLKTSAIRQGDQWFINGRKLFATGAADADYILLAVRSNPDLAINRGMSLFLVPRETPGLTISPMNKIASNGFPSCEILLDNAPVKNDALVGGQDAGWGVIAFTGAMERLLVAAGCVGLCSRVVHYVYEYAQQRMISGKPLYEIQWVNHCLSDLAVRIQAADLMVKDAVEKVSSGANPAIEICGAKAFASELQQGVIMSAMKIMGGRAYLKDHPVERWMREGLLSLYAGGTNELQKNLIARKLPGLMAQQDY